MRRGWSAGLIWKALIGGLVSVVLVVSGVWLHRSAGPGDTEKAEAPRAAGAQVSASTSPDAPSTPSPAASRLSAAQLAAESTLRKQVRARESELARLSQRAGRWADRMKKARATSEFTFANFNVQGAQHRGNAGGRMSNTLRLLDTYSVDVASFQEFERVQVNQFLRARGGTYGVFPGLAGHSSDGANAVIWRKSDFEAVKLETRPYPYFDGQIRNMPRVLLRDRKTDAHFWVTSYHNPSDLRSRGPQGKWRAIDVSRQIADANELRARTKQALIVAGDMNDQGYFCKMAPATRMHSADGGTTTNGCRLGRHPIIDWILGTSDVAFSNYRRDTSRFVNATSDHAFLATEVKVTGPPGSAREARR